MGHPSVTGRTRLRRTTPLSAEKVEQAIGLLDELDLDVWITFTQKMGTLAATPYILSSSVIDLGAGL